MNLGSPEIQKVIHSGSQEFQLDKVAIFAIINGTIKPIQVARYPEKYIARNL